MKRHLQRCGVLFCALLIVPGMVAELHAQTSIAPPDSLVFRDPFLDENGNVTDQNAAAPGRIEFRAPFLDDSGAVTTPEVVAPPRLEFRDVFLDADGSITQTDVAPTGGLEYREIFLTENGGVIVQNPDGTLETVSPEEAKKKLADMDDETRALYELIL